MKKTLLVVFTVLALVLAAILADRATRVRPRVANIVGVVPGFGSLEALQEAGRVANEEQLEATIPMVG